MSNYRSALDARTALCFDTERHWPSAIAWSGSLDRAGELRRSDMFVVCATKKNRSKPRRGGMGGPVAIHAAPTGLGWLRGRGVTINMSPRRGLALAGACIDRPNLAAALDGGHSRLFAILAHSPAASKPHCWAAQSDRISDHGFRG
jgi:hypothetical protein